MMYKKIIKQAIDTALCITGITVCTIPMVVIATAIKIDSDGPIVFKQERLGKDKKPFIIYKFRTMCDGAYEKGGIATKSNDPRITKIGSILRRTSIDEWPQMINILKGDMAIIGPRPVLDWEYEEFSSSGNYESRFDVKPGLFCSIDLVNRAADRITQFTMDAKYAETVTFLTDAKIFFGVIRTVVSGKNVYREEIGKNEKKV